MAVRCRQSILHTRHITTLQQSARRHDSRPPLIAAIAQRIGTTTATLKPSTGLSFAAQRARDSAATSAAAARLFWNSALTRSPPTPQPPTAAPTTTTSTTAAPTAEAAKTAAPATAPSGKAKNAAGEEIDRILAAHGEGKLQIRSKAALKALLLYIWPRTRSPLIRCAIVSDRLCLLCVEQPVNRD